jgi:hypothetical protein
VGVYGGPEIVESGLVLALDAANSKSYPGSGTTWTDLSGNGNNGTLVNGVGYSGSNLGSLSFDGVDDRVNCGSNSTFNITPSLTINAWIFPTGFGENNFGRIFEKVNSYVFFLDNTGTFGTNGIRYSVSGNVGTGTINNVVNLNVWNNFTIVHSGTSATLYKNGLSVGTITSLPTLPNIPSSSVYIGNNGGLDRTFDGNIAQVSIYNRTLTPQEIQQNYNATRGRYGI